MKTFTQEEIEILKTHGFQKVDNTYRDNSDMPVDSYVVNCDDTYKQFIYIDDHDKYVWACEDLTDSAWSLQFDNFYEFDTFNQLLNLIEG